jgi:peroxiredoxin
MLAQNQPALPTDKIRKLRRSNTILVLTCLIALGFIVVNLRRVGALKRESADIKAELQRTPQSLRGDSRAHVGDLLASFGGPNSAGNRGKVVYDGKSRYLLFIFSPQCGNCIEEFPSWNKIALQARKKNYLVLGLSTGSATKTTANSRRLDFEVLSMGDEAVLRAYRVETIPQVVLTSSYGRVEWLNYGRLTDANTQELLATLDMVQATSTDW